MVVEVLKMKFKYSPPMAGEMESFDKPRLSQQILEIEDVDVPETMPSTATFLWLGEVVYIFEVLFRKSFDWQEYQDLKRTEACWF